MAGKPKARFMEIDPSTAQAFLERNTRNRKVKKRTVAAYTRDMSLGRWDVTGEAISFDEDGVLIDGQHRLFACVQSGKPFTALVVENVQQSVNVDAGPRRTLADWLTIEGVPNAAATAGATKILAYYELCKGQLDPSNRTVTLTLKDYVRVFERRNRIIVREIRESWRLYSDSERVFSPGYMTGLHIIFTKAGKELAEWYRLRLYDGYDLTDRHSAYWVRRAFMRQRPGHRLTTREKYALLIKGFNEAGRDCPKLFWHASGPRAEPFPELDRRDDG